MADILQEIVAHKRVEVEQFKQLVPPQQLYREVEQLIAAEEGLVRPSMRQELLHSQHGIIAEFKHAHHQRDGSRKRDVPTSFRCPTNSMVLQP